MAILNYTGTISRGTTNSAGLDLTVQSINSNGNLTTVDTQVSVAIPEGYFGLLVARSSLHKSGWMLANSVGIIDSDYRGSIRIILCQVPGVESKEICVGQRIAQLVIVPYVQPMLNPVKSLDVTERVGGFGSTG